MKPFVVIKTTDPYSGNSEFVIEPENPNFLKAANRQNVFPSSLERILERRVPDIFMREKCGEQSPILVGQFRRCW